MPMPGASRRVTTPLTGTMGWARKNWWMAFHLIRNSSMGVVGVGHAAMRCALAGVEWPWGITGTS